MVKASDFFSYGEQVEIIAECPLKGLKGELVYVSEESLQIEVIIEYDEYENCTSYFIGFAKDIKKAS